MSPIVAKHRHGTEKVDWAYHLVRWVVGLIYLTFGGLKFFAGASPAEFLAGQTIHQLTLGGLSPAWSLSSLALGEVLLGLALIFNSAPRVTFAFFLLHMCGTFTPLFLMPELMFRQAPWGLTLEAQYILKNLVFTVAVAAVFTRALFPKELEQLSQSLALEHTASATSTPPASTAIEWVPRPNSQARDR